MAMLFVAESLSNSSIIAVFLPRLDSTYQMITNYNIYCAKERCQLVLYVHSCNKDCSGIPHMVGGDLGVESVLFADYQFWSSFVR